jgi:DNA modification methylase
MNRVFFGDCRDIMRDLKAQRVKVQTCVTSPPYYGLRDYGVKGQIGLESSPDEYVSALVEVFRCVRDVLLVDGTLWLNIGDSYSPGARTTQIAPTLRTSTKDAASGKQEYLQNFSVRPKGDSWSKPKDLLGIPWRVAFALQADGWYLRQDIIWHKPNPMPESVTDRCTKAHEYIFLLAKSERYYFDGEAMKEPAKYAGEQLGIVRGTKRRADAMNVKASGNEKPGADADSGETRNRRSVWTVATKPYSGAHFATFPPDLITPCIMAGSRTGDIVLDPFMGSGTTAMVAQQLGRKYIGCELNADYEPLQRERTAQAALLI